MFEAESHPIYLHALNKMKSNLCLLMLQNWNSPCVSSCFKQIESCAMSLMPWTGWNLTCGSSCLRLKVTLCLFMLWTRWNLSCASSCFKAETRHVSLLKQVETCAMFLMLWTCWKLTCVSSCLEQADSHPLCLFMLWTGWNLTCASSCFKAEICHVSLHALNRLKVVVCLMLWTCWKLTCGSSCLRLKVTLCLFMLSPGWHLTCASPCFKAETHPVSLHVSNRLKLMLCLSCYEINRLKVTLCLFMLWTGWHLTCASPCFKAETRHVSFQLHALNRLKLVLCSSCFEHAESWPVSLHALNRLTVTLFVSSCFEQDEIWPVPPHASKLKFDMCLFMP